MCVIITVIVFRLPLVHSNAATRGVWLLCYKSSAVLSERRPLLGAEKKAFAVLEGAAQPWIRSAALPSFPLLALLRLV